MKKSELSTITRLASAALLASALTLQGCSSLISATTDKPIDDAAEDRTTGSWIDDEIIETKALVNLDKASEQLSDAHISVVSYNGVVLLAGQVPYPDLRQLAAETVAKINGVQRVHNELTVGENSSMVVRSNDSWLSTKIKSQLIADKNIRSDRIKVVTENGVVYLMGKVMRDEADRATETARSTSGVQKVVRIFEYL